MPQQKHMMTSATNTTFYFSLKALKEQKNIQKKRNNTKNENDRAPDQTDLST
jgi:hypothetical protein